ncbi:MAG: hypothetical protein FWD57_01350 [Polyangiaceae bacterium]|nr:hypothetical protein [Polyangiaceae bacterium]
MPPIQKHRFARYQFAYAVSCLLASTPLACGPAKTANTPTPVQSTESAPREDAPAIAKSPELADLERLLTEQWGWRNDKQDVFHFPLPDWNKWKRVRYWGMPAFVGFRYDDSHRVVSGLWLRKLRSDDPEDPNVCFDRMNEWSKPAAKAYQTKLTFGPRTTASWKYKDDVLVQSIDAEITSLFARRVYRAVIGISFGWPRVCVMYGYAFRDLEIDGDNTASRVRDRFAAEAYSRLTVKDPQRPPDGIEELPIMRGD